MNRSSRRLLCCRLTCFGVAVLLSGASGLRPTMAQAQDTAPAAPVAPATSPATAVKKAEAPAQTIFEAMMQAFIENDYAGFQAFGDPGLRGALTKEIFDRSAAFLVPHMKKGYKADFLTTLDRKEGKMYVWKLTFEDGNDEMLCNMTLKNDKAAAFFVL